MRGRARGGALCPNASAVYSAAKTALLTASSYSPARARGVCGGAGLEAFPEAFGEGTQFFGFESALDGGAGGAGFGAAGAEFCPGCGEVFQAGEGGGAVPFLGAFVFGVDKEFSFGVDSALEAASEERRFPFGEPFKALDADDSAGFGVYLVDVLPAFAAGAGEGKARVCFD